MSSRPKTGSDSDRDSFPSRTSSQTSTRSSGVVKGAGNAQDARVIDLVLGDDGRNRPAKWGFRAPGRNVGGSSKDPVARQTRPLAATALPAVFLVLFGSCPWLAAVVIKVARGSVGRSSPGSDTVGAGLRSARRPVATVLCDLGYPWPGGSTGSGRSPRSLVLSPTWDSRPGPAGAATGGRRGRLADAQAKGRSGGPINGLTGITLPFTAPGGRDRPGIRGPAVPGAHGGRALRSIDRSQMKWRWTSGRRRPGPSSLVIC